MMWSYLEYIPLRLIRRWLVTDRAIEHLGRWLPYVEANEGSIDPGAVVEKWQAAAEQADVVFHGARIAELGSGSGFATGQAALEAGAAAWTGIEPHRVQSAPPTPLKHVSWAGDLDPASVDLIVSHSVLEHIRQPDLLLADLDRALAPGGAMIHVVDYRDHFFKYPYHFLTVSEVTWRRWLDPGDLPRWRLYDHVSWFEQAGWAVEVIDEARDTASFERVKASLSQPFDQAPDTVDVTAATLLIRRKGDG